MTRPRLAVAVALAVFAAATSQALAQDSEARSFVVRLVEVINSKSLEQRRALLHPASVPCASIEPELFYARMVTRQSRDPIPADYTWKLHPVSPDEPLMFAGKLDYRVRPTHMLQLTFNPAPSSSRTIVFQLVREGSRWFEMIPCPTPEAIAEAREARRIDAQRADRVQGLVSKMSPELKSQLLELLRTGRRLDATKHYQAATGEDMTTSVEVVERLAPR